jgi:hypothetical protein
MNPFGGNIMQAKLLRVSWLAMWFAFAVVPAYAAKTILTTGDITTDVSTWGKSSDSGATIGSLQNVTDATYGTVLEMSYDLGTGQWVNIDTPNFPSTLNLSSLGNALLLDLKGDGGSNLVKVELQDINNQTYVSGLVPTAIPDWLTMAFPLSSFVYAYGGNTTTATFAFNQIKQINLTVNPLGISSGSVSFDNLVATNLPASYAAVLAVDECENRTLNALNSPVGVQGVGTVNTTTAVAPMQGTYCFQISNPGAADNSGIYEFIYRNNDTGQPISVTPYTHVSMYVQAPSAVTGNVRFALKDLSVSPGPYENMVNLQNYLPGSSFPIGNWARVLIPLGDLAGPNPINYAQLGQMTFFLPPSSSIYLDHVTFESITYSAKPAAVIDSMDTFYNLSPWKTGHESGATVSLATVPGKTGSGLKMSYSFSGGASSGQWVTIHRGFALNLLEDDSDTLQFDYWGDGNNNNLELKPADIDGTAFIFRIPKLTATNQTWKTLSVPYKNLTYFSGIDHTFDFTQLAKISLAITKGDGGSGRFRLHNFRFLHQSDFQQTLPSGRLISNLTIDNNPFAPQTDSFKTTATFTYTLSETAQVTLTIYDLAGNQLQKLDAGLQAAGQRSLVWDGLDRNRSLVRNGLYLYIFDAKATKTSQKIKNIIGVVR